MAKTMDTLTDFQEILEAVSAVLNLEATFVNSRMIRVAGTGPCQHRIGEELHPDSAFGQALRSGTAVRVDNPQVDNICKDCGLRPLCRERAHVANPILAGEPIGVLGLVAFTDAQREQLLHGLDRYADFLTTISKLLGDRVGETLFPSHRSSKKSAAKKGFDRLVYKSDIMAEVIWKAERVAATDTTVLLQSESGTGKELLARAIHETSQRQNGPFVAVNCAAIPENLLESELFGYADGAFTGAKRGGKPGKFELANAGTIFLDEIGDMSPALQAKMLRVIQELEVSRIGDIKTTPLDVRIIAATNQNLEKLVEQKAFREDLFFRLSVIPIEIPPLRERKDDILPLAEHILHKKANKRSEFSTETKKGLHSYNWPGNVRELENAIEHALILSNGFSIQPDTLPKRILQGASDQQRSKQKGMLTPLKELEHKELARGIQLYGSGDQGLSRIAQELGISRSTIYRRLKEYKLV